MSDLILGSMLIYVNRLEKNILFQCMKKACDRF